MAMSHPAKAAAWTSESPSLAIRDAAIVTRLTLDASPEEAWSALLFYEETEARPAWCLRLLLPLPIRSLGGKTEVGDDALCLYESGYLVKRITELVRGRRLRFDVIRQEVAVGNGILVRGGWYSFEPLPDRRTEVELGTRYVSPWKPRWLWRAIETAVGHRFHRHILRAMRRRVLDRRRSASGGGPQ